jgi:hypothetical protein
VYNAVYAKVSEMFKARRDERIDSAFDLLDRMLPTEVLQLPVAEHADKVAAFS